VNYLSISFLWFFVILILILKVTNGVEKQNVVLLIASYIFYALGDVRFLILLFLVSFSMWILGNAIEHSKEINTKKSKYCLIAGVTLDIFVLMMFKYLNFFAEGFSKLFGLEHTVIHIILPIGISFYIFQSISYLADVYMGKIEAEKSLINILLYIGFFPQIVSGPIVKAYDFLPQIRVSHKITIENLSWGIQKFLVGVFKKKVIADRLAISVNAVYDAPAAYSGLTLLITVVAYSMQIYYDFSGYSDMAIGIGRILGFDLGKNFNLPYLAKNLSEFWNRWHISLSSWFKEYVYIPLGGSKKGRLRTYRNLFITMLLSGLWHGANWTFVIWGGCHALLSVLEKVCNNLKKRYGWTGNKVTELVAIGWNFILVSLLWVPFRAKDLGQVRLIFERIFSLEEGVDYVYTYTLTFLAMMILVEVIACYKNEANDIWKPLELSKFGNKVIFCFFTILIFCFAYWGDSAFIYAQF